MSTDDALFKIFCNHLYNDENTDEYKELSGWDQPPLTNMYQKVKIEMHEYELRRYYFDYEMKNPSMDELKAKIVHHFSKVEGVCLSPREVHLTYGGTGALAILLHYLKEEKIRTIVVDPPLYFSVLHLARSLGINIRRVDRSIDRLHSAEPLLSAIRERRDDSKAVLLTQPRYVLSTSYTEDHLAEVCELLGRDDILIIDKALDMATGKNQINHRTDRKIIVIRSLAKPVTLYGVRLAAIILPDHVRSKINMISEWVLGGLDIGMLKLAEQVIRDERRFYAQVRACASLVREKHGWVRSYLASPLVDLPRPQRGYLGYAVVDTRAIGRFHLYQFLLKNHINAIFSGQLGLMRAHDKELIRINYLLDIDRAVKCIYKFIKIQDRPRKTAKS